MRDRLIRSKVLEHGRYPGKGIVLVLREKWREGDPRLLSLANPLPQSLRLPAKYYPEK